MKNVRRNEGGLWPWDDRAKSGINRKRSRLIYQALRALVKGQNHPHQNRFL